MKPGYLLLALATGILIILALTFRQNLLDQCQQVWPALCGAPPEPAAESAPAPAAVAEPAGPDMEVPATPPIQPDSEDAPPPVVEPTYTADDDTLRVELAQLEPPSSWLELKDLRQRLAAGLVSLADGFLPRKLMGPVQPAAAPSAIPQSGRPSDQKYLLVDNGAERFGPVIEVALRLPPAAAAQLLERLEPALQKELVQLGDRRDLDTLLESILAQLEAVPELDNPPQVRRPGLRYVYVDPALESLSDLKKTALRIGPELRQRIIDYGRAVLAERARARSDAPRSE